MRSFSCILTLFVAACYQSIHAISIQPAIIEFAKFHLLENDFKITGVPDKLTAHKVIFAIKQNTELLDDFLTKSSDPTSESYGQHFNRNQVSSWKLL